jgi:hypothetical protein
LRLSGSLLALLVGYMPADDAATDSANYSVVPGIVTGDTTNYGAFQATFRTRSAGGCKQGTSQQEQHHALH